MGWFDPPHKKMLRLCPQYVQQLWNFDSMIHVGLTALGMPPSHKISDDVKASAVGHFAQFVAFKDPENWSPDAVHEIRRLLQKVNQRLSESDKSAILMVVRDMLGIASSEAKDERMKRIFEPAVFRQGSN